MKNKKFNLFIYFCVILFFANCTQSKNRKLQREDVRTYLVFRGDLIPLPLEDEIMLLGMLLLVKENPENYYHNYNKYNLSFDIFPKSCTVIISNTPICPDGMKVDFLSEHFTIARRWLAEFGGEYLYNHVISNYITRDIEYLFQDFKNNNTNNSKNVQYAKCIVFDDYINLSYVNMINLYYTNDQVFVDWFLNTVPQLKWNDKHFGYVVPGYNFKNHNY